MNESTSVGKRLQKLDIGPEFDTYTKVIIHAGQTTDAEGKTTDLDYIAGNDSGRTLEVSDPNGTQAKANALLAKLQNSKFQYQPYTASNALLDPAAELGDGITLSDTFSAIYTRDVRYSALMAANLEAPSDEEIDHEFPFIPKQSREYKRETAFTRSALRINENEITAEVQRVDRDVFNPQNQNSIVSKISVEAGRITQEISNRQTAINGLNQELTSRIQQTDTNIRADVVAKTGGNRTSFGWELLATGWNLYSGNTTVLKATSSGIEVSGKITAKSGYIGNGSSGFTIGNTAIYNGITSMSDATHNGLYLGTDGIRLGKGNFNVTSAGVLTAKSGYIGNGTAGFTIGNTFIRNGMTGRDDTTNNGIYLGTNGIALGKGNFKVTDQGALTAKTGTVGEVTINSSYGLYTNGKTSSTSTNTGFLISKSGAIYLGAYDSTLKSCPFQVTAAGAATATNLAIKGGSISIKNNGVETFKVSNVGKVTASDLNITGGTISIKDGSTEKFKVTNKGEVTASNLIVKGGSIAIGSKFNVATDGTVTATALKFNGGSITIGSKFTVKTDGTVTATGGEIGGFTFNSTSLTKSTPDVSTNGQSQYQLLLNAPSTISTSNGAIFLRHRVYNNGGYGSWVNDFRVGYDGAVTASKLNFTGGSISIGNRFSVDSAGNLSATNANLTGRVTATGGTIGGFKIYSNKIMTYPEDQWGNPDFENYSGVYIGSNCIALGKKDDIGNYPFYVGENGWLYASNAEFRGTLRVGGTDITAEALRRGAQESYDNYPGWNGTKSTVDTNSGGWNSAATSTSEGGYCYGGASNGYTAYDHVRSAWIGDYQLNFGSGITILGGNFTDSNGGRCSGSASNSSVVTATYVGGNY